MFAMKVLTKEEVQEFILKCKEAEEDLENASRKLEKIYDEFERGLTLIGSTVVEDRLQD